MIGCRGARPALRFFLVAGLSIIWTSPVGAETTSIDDSSTQMLEPLVSMRWEAAVPRRSGDNNMLVGTTRVRVRLNVMPWLRHAGRIYLVLPAQPPGPITARWDSQGRLLPGQLHSGSRTLVYAGPITTAFIEDVLSLQFSIDGTLVRRPFPVSFRFEMDEE